MANVVGPVADGRLVGHLSRPRPTSVNSRVGRCDEDVSGLDQGPIFSERRRVLSAQQTRQRAGVGASMHDDKDRRRAWNRQRGGDAPEGIKATGGGPNDYNSVQPTALLMRSRVRVASGPSARSFMHTHAALPSLPPECCGPDSRCC